MSVIVAIKENDIVYMGADTQSTAGDYLYRIKTAENIAASSLACAVKLADLSDNADRNRISQITEVDERRFRKYAYAYRYLSETNECMLDYNLGRLREFLKSR